MVMIIFCSGQFHSFHFDKQQTYYFIYLFMHLCIIHLFSWSQLWHVGSSPLLQHGESFFSYSDLGGVLSLQQLEVGRRSPSQ